MSAVRFEARPAPAPAPAPAATYLIAGRLVSPKPDRPPAAATP